MVDVTTLAVVWVRVHCPWRNHDMRFEVPQGVVYRAMCYACGREFERVA